MKVTLITGAASGLGYEFAKLYAKDNNNLLLIDINEEGLNNAKKEINNLYPNIVIDLLIADLSDVNELKKVYNYTTEKEYFINNLVNSAGFGDRCDFKVMNIDKQITMTNVDCNALLYFTRVYLDDMLKNDEGRGLQVAASGFCIPCSLAARYIICKQRTISYK